MALELLRRRTAAPAEARERLLAKSLDELAATGVREASLGLLPVVATNGTRGPAGPFAVAERLGSIYQYDDLLAVKDLFAARWEPRHLVYPGDAALPRIAVAVVDAHTTLHERSPLPRLMAAARALRHRAVHLKKA
jgi:lysylphosphatidylglycerol synthetase-like protein (DUF2156 family)